MRGHVIMFPPPSRRLQIASHCSALVAAIGVPAAAMTISFCASAPGGLTTGRYADLHYRIWVCPPLALAQAEAFAMCFESRRTN